MRRPRPFVVLKDARLYVPQARRFDTNGIGYVTPKPDGTLPANANRHSFPSAHAANWFAIATVGFLFYRRSWSLHPVGFYRKLRTSPHTDDSTIGCKVPRYRKLRHYQRLRNPKSRYYRFSSYYRLWLVEWFA